MKSSYYRLIILFILTLYLSGCSSSPSPSKPIVNDKYTLITHVNYIPSHKRKRLETKKIQINHDSVIVLGDSDSWEYRIDTVLLNNDSSYHALISGGHILSTSPQKLELKVFNGGYAIGGINKSFGRSFNISKQYHLNFEKQLNEQGIVF